MIDIKHVTDPRFPRYGKVVNFPDQMHFTDLVREKTPRPTNGIVYEPICDQLMDKVIHWSAAPNLCFHNYFAVQFFRGRYQAQIGYCCGHGLTLNALEWHEGRELIVNVDPIVLLLASQEDMHDFTLDTSLVEAFYVPAKSAVLLHSGTLHYAPCTAQGETGFQVAIILPEGTNDPLPEGFVPETPAQAYWTAKNKCLIAHEDSPEAKAGARIGLIGENITLNYR